MPLDLDAYLDRIRYDGPLDVSEATLTRLHESHVGTIPFENLDLMLGLPIRLDLESLQAKLIAGRRGGYCYEHGTLFKAVLDQIGFTSHILTARVRLGGTGRINPRTHMLLKVETPSGAFIADVGFGGDGLLHPLPLMPDVPTHVPGAAYRLRHEGTLWVLDGDVGGNDFVEQYAFTLEPQYPVDIEVANHYMATHPASPFRRIVTAQLTRPHERLILRNRVLQRRTGAEVEETTIADTAGLLDILASKFGLVLPAGTHFASPSVG